VCDREQGSKVSFAKIPTGAEREAYLHLLLLADESEIQVRASMNNGTLYAYWTGDDSAPAGIILATPDSDETVELKAVAVASERQGQGIGTQMMRAVLDDLRDLNVRRVTVGTGNAGIGQLAFYQKAGFRLRHIERDYFTPERGYPADLSENGIPLRDMVWMDLEFASASDSQPR